MWFLPVVLGFIIGLVTNWIAVVMLFRPHEPRPWLFFWPQGLVPRERNSLARSVGQAVGGELLNPERLAEALSSEEGMGKTRAFLDEMISELSTSISEKPVSELISVLRSPEWFAVIREEIFSAERMSTLQVALSDFIYNCLIDLSDRKLENLFGIQAMEKIRQLLARRLSETGLLKKGGKFVKKSRWFFTPSYLFEKLYGTEDSPPMQAFADDLAGYIVDTLKAHSAGELLGINDRNELKRAAGFAAGKIMDALTSSENRQILADHLKERVTPILEKTPNQLACRLAPGTREALRAQFEDFVMSLLAENVASVLQALNVSGVVEARVKQYPITELESLVLEISGHHLKWITLWGGILGALLGALQMLLVKMI